MIKKHSIIWFYVFTFIFTIIFSDWSCSILISLLSPASIWSLGRIFFTSEIMSKTFSPEIFLTSNVTPCWPLNEEKLFASLNPSTIVAISFNFTPDFIRRLETSSIFWASPCAFIIISWFGLRFNAHTY